MKVNLFKKRIEFFTWINQLKLDIPKLQIMMDKKNFYTLFLKLEKALQKYKTNE